MHAQSIHRVIIFPPSRLVSRGTQIDILYISRNFVDSHCRETGLRTTIGLMAILTLSSCASNGPAPSTAGHPSAEVIQILAVMDAYMHEISANDLEAMKVRQTPEGMTYRHRLNPD